MRASIERLCRVNGKEPTARERWKAFYSLYRATMRTSFLSAHDLGDCLRIIADPSWVALVNQIDPMEGVKMPVFLRRRFVEMSRGARLARRQKYTERLLNAIMRPVE